VHDLTLSGSKFSVQLGYGLGLETASEQGVELGDAQFQLPHLFPLLEDVLPCPETAEIDQFPGCLDHLLCCGFAYLGCLGQFLGRCSRDALHGEEPGFSQLFGSTRSHAREIFDLDGTRTRLLFTFHGERMLLTGIYLRDHAG